VAVSAPGPVYYNEFDPKAAAWLRELIAAGHLPDGEVDERSIIDVSPSDLAGYRQCHFFAGIGGWPYALQLAGLADRDGIWTGSPPCQPFSSAGQQKGRDDERHLAPHFVDLVRAGRPRLLFGEQVASAGAVGRAAKRTRKNAGAAPEWAWLDDLSDRLEAARYAVGAGDIPAAGVGAPHIRQRLFFGATRLAFPHGGERGWRPAPAGRDDRNGPDAGRAQGDGGAAGRGADGGLGDAPGLGRERRPGPVHRGPDGQRRDGPADDSEPLRPGLGGEVWRSFSDWFEVCWRDCDDHKCDCGAREDAPEGWYWDQDDGWVHILDVLARARRRDAFGLQPVRSDTGHGGWGAADWLHCRDGKWRPVEPGTFPLASRLPGRVGLLRGYGNAIVPQAAAAFVMAFMDALDEMGD
jgi:DNA (cytosine-5)-methyltransferase 1